MVAIGDDDSGFLLHKDVFGLRQLVAHIIPQTPSFFGVKRYTQFGISISKADDWHATLRHHAYDPRQPSGHFHQDVGSVTIAYQGIPIVIDPGSYLYSASRDWRNKFRSVSMHNACYLPLSEEVITKTEGRQSEQLDLFGLDLQRALCDNLYHNGGVLRTQYRLADGSSVERMVEIDEHECSITDHVSSNSAGIMKNFILAPNIAVTRDGGDWFLVHGGKPILQIIVPADDQLSVEDTWMAPGYGRKIRTSCLRMKHGDAGQVMFRVI